MTWAPTQSFWAFNNRPTANNCVLSTLCTFCTLLTVSSVSRRGVWWFPHSLPLPFLPPTLWVYHSSSLCKDRLPSAQNVPALSLFPSLHISLSTTVLAPSLICCVTLRQSFPLPVPDLHILSLINKNLIYPGWLKFQNRGLMNSKSRRI